MNLGKRSQWESGVNWAFPMVSGFESMEFALLRVSLLRGMARRKLLRVAFFSAFLFWGYLSSLLFGDGIFWGSFEISYDDGLFA
jgi:hypothetical protein